MMILPTMSLKKAMMHGILRPIESDSFQEFYFEEWD